MKYTLTVIELLLHPIKEQTYFPWYHFLFYSFLFFFLYFPSTLQASNITCPSRKDGSILGRCWTTPPSCCLTTWPCFLEKSPASTSTSTSWWGTSYLSKIFPTCPYLSLCTLNTKWKYVSKFYPFFIYEMCLNEEPLNHACIILIRRPRTMQGPLCLLSKWGSKTQKTDQF